MEGSTVPITKRKERKEENGGHFKDCHVHTGRRKKLILGLLRFYQHVSSESVVEEVGLNTSRTTLAFFAVITLGTILNLSKGIFEKQRRV